MRKGLAAAVLLASFAASCKKSPRPSAALETATVQAVDEAFARCHYWEGEEGEKDPPRATGMAQDCPPAIRKARDAYKLYPDDSRLAAIIVQLADYLGKTQ